ncbi:MAG: hypothetical protein ACE15B_12820 [Bryobacteraceae bacterium]
MANRVRSRFRFWRSLAAILLGNAVYYALYEWLPPRARHQPYHIDWGLAVDFWFCVAFYGLLNLIRPPRER